MAGRNSRPGAISDSSPLVHYARIGKLDLLNGVFGEIAVPDAVWHEVVDEDRIRPGSSEVAAAAWIRRIAVADSFLLDQLRTQLDPGESQAIALAYGYTGSIPLLVDERRARRVARSHGLQIIGSAGLLISAKQRGLIEAVEPILRSLVRSGFRLSDHVIAQVLAGADER